MKDMYTFKRYKALGFIGCSTFLFAAFSFHFGIFNLWQEQLNDRFFLKQSQPQNIIIVAVDNASLKEIGQWPWKRSIFAEVLKKLQEAKSIGLDIHFSEPSRFGNKDDLILQKAFEESKVPITMPIELRSQGDIAVEPLALFRKFSKVGFVNVTTDADNIIRKIPTHIQNFYNFGSRVSNITEIPSPLRINYTGPAGTYLTVSLIDVLHGNIPQDLIANKYVLIGATADSLRDVLKTPFGPMPGVEIHANIINTILQKDYLHELSPLWSFLLIALITIGAILEVAFIRNFIQLLLIVLGTILLISIIGISLFSIGILIPLLYFLLTFIITSAATLAYQYVNESKEKQFIRKSFQYYLSPDVVHELIQNPHKLSLNGEKRKVTILFSDIRGFTTLSETMTPEELTHFINEYLTAMTDIIMDNKGMVDKYIGDAIMAFWGAPVENENQTHDAAIAAMQMSARLVELNNEWKLRNIPHLGIGVGINTGEVVVGNMGSSKRFNYTIMGDEVNFASRLEGINKMYGTSSLISESTAAELVNNDSFFLRELDMVMVKGKKEPKKIFELITTLGKNSAERLLQDFTKARALYTEGKWHEAITAFEYILTYQDDPPSKTFIERCKEFITTPPSNWNGVYEFHSK